MPYLSGSGRSDRSNRPGEQLRQRSCRALAVRGRAIATATRSLTQPRSAAATYPPYQSYFWPDHGIPALAGDDPFVSVPLRPQGGRERPLGVVSTVIASVSATGLRVYGGHQSCKRICVPQPYNFRAITDGLSNTIAMGERCLGTGGGDYVKGRRRGEPSHRCQYRPDAEQSNRLHGNLGTGGTGRADLLRVPGWPAMVGRVPSTVMINTILLSERADFGSLERQTAEQC